MKAKMSLPTRGSAGRKTGFRVIDLLNILSVLSACRADLAVDYMLSARLSRAI